LSNVLLDDVDQELERRGHRLCRYADDATIYVKSRRAGRRRYYSLTTLGREVARSEAGRLSGLVREALAKKVLRKADL
jgi:RNA-directed DNA polymerase